MTRKDLEFNDKFKEFLKKNHIPVWNMIQAWLCIEFDRFQEACEYVDPEDLKTIWDGKWKMNIFKQDSEGFKLFKKTLKDKGFGINGLEGHFQKPSYNLIGPELEVEFYALLKKFPEISNEMIVDTIVDAYREYQEPGKQQYFIPKLSNFLKVLEFD